MNVLWSVIAGLFNGVGASLLFLKSKYTEAELNRYLNLSAGVMLAAALFSLLVPAYDNVRSLFEPQMSVVVFGVGLICGYLFLGSLNFIVPHLHNIYTDSQKQVILFVLAIALHKVPEGLAMGVAYANNEATGHALTLGILLQNIPEGLSVALSLLAVGFRKITAVLMAALTGLMQPVGMAMVLMLGNLGDGFISFSMAMAGSALLFVVINEVLPQSYRTHEDAKNSGALFCGFLVMALVAISVQ